MLITKQKSNLTLIVVVLLLLAIIAAAVRVADLNHPSFTWDEWSVYNASVNYHYDGKWFAPIYYGFTYGQLPFNVAHFIYMVVGVRDWVPRAMSAAVGVLVVVGVGFMGVRLYGIGWGFFTGLLAALCPFHIAGSRLGLTQGHILHTVFLVAGLILFLESKTLVRHMGRVTWFLIGLCFGLSLGTDLLAAYWCVTALITGLWALVTRRTSWGVLVLVAFGGVTGLAIASPMYVLYPVEAWRALVHGNLIGSDLYGYLWLGEVVERMPLYYYAIILGVKLSPALVLLFITSLVWVVVFGYRTNVFFIVLAGSLWMLIPISFNGWVGPNYIAGALPVIYLVSPASLVAWWGSTSKIRVRAICIFCTILVVAGSVWKVVVMHPDYPMTGIHYSHRFYGDFQGPAVSHGQWIGEAMDFIAQDSIGHPPRVLVFDAFWMSQIAYYAGKYGLPPPVRLSCFSSPEDAWGSFDYILMNRDARQMVAPLVPDGIEKNRVLVDWVNTRDSLDLVKTFYSGTFPMVWVYKVQSQQVLTSDVF